MNQTDSNVRTYCEVSKVDSSLGIVFGWGIVCKVDGAAYYDLQGDHISEEEMCRAVVKFMETGAAADVMHDEQAIGKVFLSMPITSDMAPAFGTLRKTGWFVGWRPADRSIVKRFQPGPNGEPPELRGFSIGGRGRRIPPGAAR
jgi:hypothetical protein